MPFVVIEDWIIAGVTLQYTCKKVFEEEEFKNDELDWICCRYIHFLFGWDWESCSSLSDSCHFSWLSVLELE